MSLQGDQFLTRVRPRYSLVISDYQGDHFRWKSRLELRIPTIKHGFLNAFVEYVKLADPSQQSFEW
jgi:hypothetical protein